MFRRFNYSFICTSAALAAFLTTPPPGRAQSLSAYTITTVAGNGTAGFSGDAGAATAAQLSDPCGVAVTPGGIFYIADQLNHRVRQVSGGTITTFAGNGTAGISGDNGQATSAEFNFPVGVALDSTNNLYIADSTTNSIRKVASGVITQVAGQSGLYGYFGDGAKATAAGLQTPTGVVLDPTGNMYIVDTANNKIRKVTTDGNINTMVGNQTAGFYGDGGQAINAIIDRPRAVALDAAGNLYIADSGNHRVRMVAPNGIITTVAGTGKAGFSGDGGLAVNALLNEPRALAVDPAGNLFIADYLNNRIRRVSPNGAISTVAGNGKFGWQGDGGPATNAQLFFPSGLASDEVGNIYIADTQNNAIRLLTPVADSMVGPLISKNGVIDSGAFGGATAIAPGTWIEISGTNLAPRSRAWTNADFVNTIAPTFLEGTTVTIGGRPAFISYVSPGQINVLVPPDVPTGSQPLVVSTVAGVSAPYTVQLSPLAPALLAPPSFNIGGYQFVSALLSDGVTYAAPAGSIDGTATRPVQPGETVTLYGMAFGAVTPDIPAGQLVSTSNALNLPFQIQIGGTQATVTYAGLALNQVGMYEFDVVVPNVAGGIAVPVTFSLGGTTGVQQLFIAVDNTAQPTLITAVQ